MDNISLLSIANLAVNQMIVIDKNGDIQIATIGEELPEGSVIIQRGDDPSNNNVTTQLVNQNNELQDVTDDVAQIFAALEEGQDPTQIDEELAPAAGSSQGSSPTSSASVDRDGLEIIANTNFSTSGFESIGLSQTQSLTLINLNRVNSNSASEEVLNNAPNARDDQIVTDEDTPITIDVLANDSDDDGDTLTITAVSVSEEQGRVSIVDGKVFFEPAENFNGEATIEYSVSDGQGGTDGATVTVTVNDINDIPVALNDSQTTEENTVLNKSVPEAQDVDGTIESYQLVNDVTKGTLTFKGDDGSYIFDPGSDFDYLNEGESAEVTFTYTATDDDGGVSDEKVITITVTGSNDAPEISVEEGDSAQGTISEDGYSNVPDDVDPTVITGTLTATDDDDSVGSLTWSTTGTPTVSLSSTSGETYSDYDLTKLGSFVVSKDENNQGEWIFDLNSKDAQYLDDGDTVTLTYEVVVTDDNGETGTQEVVITVTGRNDAPEISVEQGDSAQGTISEDGDSSVPYGTDPTVITGTLTATDDDDSVGSLTWSTTGTPTVSLSSTSGETYSDYDLTKLGSFVVSKDENNQGEWIFDLNSKDAQYLDDGDTVTLTYQVIVTDDNGETGTQEVVITVTGRNDAPEISVEKGDSASGSISEDGYSNVPSGTDPTVITGTLTATDDDDSVDSLTWSTSGMPTVSLSSASGETYDNYDLDKLGSFKVDEKTGEWIFDLNSKDAQYLDDGDTVTLTYQVIVTDDNGETGTQEVVITVTGRNDAPEISVEQGDSAQGTISEDGDSSVPYGTDPTVITGTLTATDDDDSVGSLTWSTTGTPTVSLSSTSGETYSDYDLTKLGSFVVSKDENNQGEWTFDLNSGVAQYLNEGDSVTLSYTVKVTDDNKDYDTQVVTIRVDGTNDIPSVASVSLDSSTDASISGNAETGYTISTAEDTTSISGSVAAFDKDSGDELTYSFGNITDGYTVSPASGAASTHTLTTPSGGVITLDSTTGDYTYEPAANYNGSDESFTVVVTDSYDAKDHVNVSLNVTAENDPPVATDDHVILTEQQTSILGNVLDNDTDVDTPHEDLKVTSVNYQGVHYPVDETTGVTITTPSGVLTINRDGSYTFEANTGSVNGSNDGTSSETASGSIAMYGVTSGNQTAIEAYIGDLENQESSTNSNGSGTGVGAGKESKLNEGESLIIDLDGSAKGVTVNLSEVKPSQVSISVYDAEGTLLTNNSDYTVDFGAHGSKIAAEITSDNGNIGYIVFGVVDSKNGKDFYRVDSVSSVTYSDSDEASTSSVYEEQFTYTVEDGDGGSDTAVLTVKGETPVEHAPTLSFEENQDSVVLSEEGLSGLEANPDSEGSPDSTNNIVATGAFTVSDVDTDSDDLSVSLVAPETTLYSNNVTIEWSSENGKLVGKAGNETILEVSLTQDVSDSGSYSYSVNLLGTVDHPDTTTEDALSFAVGIEVSDGTNKSKESLTVTIEDDSPLATENISINPAETSGSAVTSLGNYSFTQRPDESGCHKNNTFTFLDASSGQSISVYAHAIGLLDEDFLSQFSELSFSATDGLGVKSILDRNDSEVEIQFGRSEQIIMKLEEGSASSVTLNLTKFYSDESFHITHTHGEKGKITFYFEGHQVGEPQEFSATSASGQFTGEFSVDGVFDEIRLEPTDNGNRISMSNGHLDNSDFAVKSVSFSTAVADPVIATDDGVINADFGADGAGVITLTGIADSSIKTADGLSIALDTSTIDNGVNTQIWVDSNGNKVFEIELNSATGEWSYKQYAELEAGKTIEVTYDVTDADGDTVSSVPAETVTEPELISGLQGEFYNVDSQLWKIEHAVDVVNSQDANAQFIATDIHYYSSHRDDLGGLVGDNNSHLQSWLGDDGTSVAFNDRKDTNDSVIRLSGGVQIAAGSYTMKVIADDGYQIKLDGEIVASFDRNTSKRTEEFSFEVCGSGVHDLEIIYWDQGGHYVLDVSIGDSHGENYETLGSEAYPTYLPENADFVDMAENLTENIAEYASHAAGLVYDQTIIGTSNDDTKHGGSGNDHISTDNSQDKLYGKAGDDWLEGGDGNDYLEGNCGDDILNGGSAQDILHGGTGNDWLIGGDGVDTLYGEAGNDLLEGGQGQDKLYGGVGNDILIGGADGDELFGGDGNDILIGGTGHNHMFGGNGDDLFVLEGSVNFSETIEDFDVEHDAIDISDLLSTDKVEHDEIQAFLDSNVTITANDNGSGRLTLSGSNHTDSFGEGSHLSGGDVVSVLFNNQEYKINVDS